MPEIIHLVGGRQIVNPSHLTLESVLFTILLPLCTKSLMVNVIPLWVPSGLSLDAPRGAGLVVISLALGVLDRHRDQGQAVAMEEECRCREVGSLSTTKIG